MAAKTPSAPKAPVHYELYAELAIQLRHSRLMNRISLAGIAFLVLAVILVSMRPLTAVRVNGDGPRSFSAP